MQVAGDKPHWNYSRFQLKLIRRREHCEGEEAKISWDQADDDEMRGNVSPIVGEDTLMYINNGMRSFYIDTMNTRFCKEINERQ